MSDGALPLAGTAVLLRDGVDGLEVLMIERPDRGSFAGAWVFPGGGVEPADIVGDEVEDARRAAARETAEEVGLHIDPADLVAHSRWTPPVTPPAGAPKRVRTWFYLGSGDSTELVLSEAEVVTASWVRPGAMLTRHGRGEIRLYPPTWVSLHGLTAHHDVAAALVAARRHPPAEFASVRRGRIFLWEPDAAHDESVELGASGPRHRLHTDALPWRYEVSA
ncbi:NUDIX domain-containing protein [Microbacterium protaetiae]|uniref:NUDIX domain-containing protein n=1 Tax=Microbacterium protaetiae TaxID=2509458 RepID=A0A4P6ERX8_9MICO|nr:NUDIX domain-containing protein [Microbacterium protaetiae]QAY60688.1 NUDIX domain-containing protein [Microbacterium protaetiae]